MNGIRAAIAGRVARDGRLKVLPGRTGRLFLLTASLAVHDARRRWGDPTEWVKLTAWGDLACEALPDLTKGALIHAEGRLRLRHWTGRDGMPASGLELAAWTITPIGTAPPA